ncbi:MAG: 2-amino-4-hydroxy-6-hydroxymethyldihydropteridine diphosphokinase [Lentisphaeria bacterium]|nr:2-amino-4-hydroxy-6-hydroxymethyldihydropteridine diphosphokinase [Lentisphaeria bacterium]
MAKIAIALGSNLGDRKANFDAAMRELKALGIRELKLGPVLDTDPVDCPSDAGAYLNSACIGETDIPAFTLMQNLLDLEQKLGRVRTGVYHESRIIDLDMLLYDQEIIHTDWLQLPHPEMHLRDFVLAPLAVIAPDWLIPIKEITVLQAYEKLFNHS